MKTKLIAFLILMISTNILYSQLTLDDGVYRISEFQPLYTLENEIKTKKTTKHKFQATLKQEKDRIYIKITPKFKNSALMQEGTDPSIVSVKDEKLFFDLESSNKFSFKSKRFSSSIITLPFKVRFSAETINDNLSDVELGLNNINIFLGMKSTHYTYENNKLHEKSFAFGYFFGPTAIKINKNNSSLAIEEEINRLGVNSGLGVMGKINRFNLGVGLGVETIINQKYYNWEWNEGVFLGFIIGVSL